MAGDDTTGTQIRSRSDKIVSLPMFFDVTEEGLDEDDILTESLASMRMIMPGAFDVTAAEGLTVTALAATSAEGGGTVGRSLVTQRMDEETLATSFVNQGELRPWASACGARSRRRSRTARLRRRPPRARDAGGSGSVRGHLAASSAPFNAIVMADVDMLHENLWAQRVQSLFGGASYRSANGNAPFLVGALENLSGSDDLISLRAAKPTDDRSFARRSWSARPRRPSPRRSRPWSRSSPEAERKINELQAEKDPQSAYLLSPEQQAEIDRFRAQEVETRRELRKVKRDLKADIEALGTRLELLNIALIPALIIAFGAATWLLRRRSARA